MYCYSALFASILVFLPAFWSVFVVAFSAYSFATVLAGHVLRFAIVAAATAAFAAFVIVRGDLVASAYVGVVSSVYVVFRWCIVHVVV